MSPNVDSCKPLGQPQMNFGTEGPWPCRPGQVSFCLCSLNVHVLVHVEVCEGSEAKAFSHP